jgi:uncharacterized OsmC-like protein
VDAGQLRELQAPLKQRYRSEPGAALTPVSATATWDEPGITTTVAGFAGPIRAGLHPATGGDGSDACSGDLLLQALLACLGVTLRSVATAMSVELADVELRASATFDASGTLGVDRSAPVGVSQIAVEIAAVTTVEDELIDRLLTATERYCVVGQSLAQAPHLTFRRKNPTRE